MSVYTPAGGGPPGILWQHPNPLAIPTGLWVPRPYNTAFLDQFGVNPYGTAGGLTPAATTIAAASNLAVLPQATINVAAFTVGTVPAGLSGIALPAGTFAPSGYLVITIGGVDTIVGYSGANGAAGTFTGCNTGPGGLDVGISTGTLGTGQAVKQAFVMAIYPNQLWQLNSEELFTANATGSRGIRFRLLNAGLGNPIGAMNLVPATAVADGPQGVVVPTQPAGTPSPGSRMEIYQSSGGVLNSVNRLFDGPAVQGIGFLTPYN